MIQSGSFWGLLLVAVPAFWLIPARFRMALLSVTSLAYMATLDLGAVIGVAAWSIPTFYVLGAGKRATSPARFWTWLITLGVLMYLGYFKYVPVIIAAVRGGDIAGHLAIPLGISYFTFKTIHYAVESRRGTLKEHTYFDFLCYLFLFPIFTAGPIERFDHFLSERETRLTREAFIFGLTRIMHGLIKKLVIGEMIISLILSRVAPLEILIDHPGQLGAPRVAAGLMLVYFYVYMDFAGYSDIAIGASRLFGLKIMENFRWPILAPNLGNFWKRWHMTLAAWCQAYVYMPTIGLTRNPYVAVFSAFLVMGLWHGASLNWVSWGLYQATGVCAVLTLARVRRACRRPPATKGPMKYWGIPLTIAYASGGFAFTITDGHGVGAAVRILLSAIGLGE